MRLGIIAQEASKTVHEELVPYAKACGHECEVLQFPTLDITRFDQQMILQDLRSFDVLYYRTGLGHIGALFFEEVFSDAWIICCESR